jgi:ParB/RepB/Spo0J family partition protein
MASKNSPVKKWRISRLVEHEKQAALFGDVPDEELNALAADMQAHGQRHPVEILPDGTIVAGHQRVRAARLLDWKDIDVVIRSDLAEQGYLAVEAHLIGDNLVRRHLSPLARARCIKRKIEIESQIGNGNDSGSRKERIKTEIAKQLGQSKRTVNRYLLALNAPLVVQQAFDRGEITLVTAGKVAQLPFMDHSEITKRVQNGEKLADVVNEILHGSKVADQSVNAAFGRIIRCLKRDVGRLVDGIDSIDRQRLAGSRDVMTKASAVLAKMLKKAQ